VHNNIKYVQHCRDVIVELEFVVFCLSILRSQGDQLAPTPNAKKFCRCGMLWLAQENEILVEFLTMGCHYVHSSRDVIVELEFVDFCLSILRLAQTCLH